MSVDPGRVGRRGLPRFPLPLPEWLVGNPLFTAGFGLGAMGWDAQDTQDARNWLEKLCKG